ncbi:hypothetical protein CDAR_94801 [Caerostris darwini]|uniref:Uncharacterized protein n=1 Tax=Caerostris darwini TaxID=1538125 RepID=A0AAV4PMK2_9ARAC|nr:hypothetical protein CDAR_94801 [Caerostris darwini]
MLLCRIPFVYARHSQLLLEMRFECDLLIKTIEVLGPSYSTALCSGDGKVTLVCPTKMDLPQSTHALSHQHSPRENCHAHTPRDRKGRVVVGEVGKNAIVCSEGTN